MLKYHKHRGQKIDLLCGSPEKERTLEERKSPKSVEFEIFEHLITEVLSGPEAPKGALALSKILKAINAAQPEYEMENLDWQNKVLSNLSINKNFQSEKKCWKLQNV